jgi:hypothetical protein
MTVLLPQTESLITEQLGALRAGCHMAMACGLVEMGALGDIHHAQRRRIKGKHFDGVGSLIDPDTAVDERAYAAEALAEFKRLAADAEAMPMAAE